MPQRRTGISTTEEAAWYDQEPAAEFEPPRGAGLRRVLLFVGGTTIVAGLVLIAAIFVGSARASAGRDVALAQPKPQEVAAAVAPATPSQATPVAPDVTPQVAIAPVEPSPQPEAAPEPALAKPPVTELEGPPVETEAAEPRATEAKVKRAATHARANGKKSSPAKWTRRHGHLSEVR